MEVHSLEQYYFLELTGLGMRARLGCHEGLGSKGLESVASIVASEEGDPVRIFCLEAYLGLTDCSVSSTCSATHFV